MANLSEQLIYSPNYPSNYKDNDFCKWQLEAPCGMQIKLEILDFHTERFLDTLSIYDGEINYSRSLFDGHEMIYKGSVIKSWVSDYHRLALDFMSDCIVNLISRSEYDSC